MMATTMMTDAMSTGMPRVRLIPVERAARYRVEAGFECGLGGVAGATVWACRRPAGDGALVFAAVDEDRQHSRRMSAQV